MLVRGRRTGSLTVLRCLGRSFVLGLGVWRARRRRSCCAGCLRRFWVSSVLGSTTTFLRLGAIRKKVVVDPNTLEDRKSTRLNSSHQIISYAVFCLKKKTKV